MSRVLVTGGAGFLGSHLVEYLLNEGHEVRVLDDLSGGYLENVDTRATFVRASITDARVCDFAVEDIEIIYHVAAHAAEGQSIFCPIHNAMTNYIGSLNLFVAAINHDVKRIVFTTSMARYGTQDELPMVETQMRKPQDPYGVTKVATEQVLEIFSKVYGFEHVIIVPHNIYGPRQNLADPYRNVVGIFMNRVLKNKPPIIYGDGEQVRAFTYVDDCTPYLAKAGFAKNVVGEVINIGPDEEPITVKRLAELIIEISGFKGEPIYMPERPNEVKYAWCSADKARKLLGYKTTVPIKEGLTRMWNWAKTIGPQKLRYWDEFEIKTDKIPEVWAKKML
jgi:UDP-glucose 4-epimerase